MWAAIGHSIDTWGCSLLKLSGQKDLAINACLVRTYYSLFYYTSNNGLAYETWVLNYLLISLTCQRRCVICIVWSSSLSNVPWHTTSIRALLHYTSDRPGSARSRCWWLNYMTLVFDKYSHNFTALDRRPSVYEGVEDESVDIKGAPGSESRTEPR